MALTHSQDTVENLALPQDAFDLLLRSTMAFKDRSHSTCHEVHLPELLAQPSLDTVLIGDSMLERFKTTGTATRIYTNLPRSLNAGCGGDKIENVLYRLSFMNTPLEQQQVKLWVVMVGTNNLRKKGLRSSEIDHYRLLLQNLLRLGGEETKILVCELFKRKDFEDHCIEEANDMIHTMVKEMNANLGRERIFWSEAPKAVIKDEHLDDHVHLNTEGYHLWDEALFSRIQSFSQ
ncbi:hypothetical protein EMPS_00578 [Entomortierella parvispora]|uniref:SGNH hydrolase-type esterase domain-containing protein n=1 Tax=Entomortierella parvispora TaxID=205924 RepID=A0A9P3H1C4_9FUNG|nr:hypothetical protein EMPS_00578 [Entomortierella parvispora]